MNLNRRDFLTLAGGALAGAALRPALALAEPPVRRYRLVAAPAAVDLGLGRGFTAWTYNGAAPGPVLRVVEGETLEVELVNRLPEPTTIHWHGLPVPNAMDGVPGVTQAAVPPGGSFTYRFTAAPAGSYLYHSHQGLQLDRGLYGALIVEPRRPEGGWDQEHILLLEDWATVDGGGPAAVRRRPAGGMMGGMMGRRFADTGQGPPLEPVYDAYAVNGRAWPAVEPVRVRRGDRVRLRLGNPSAVTIYDLMLAGHRLTVLAADGQPVAPFTADVVRLAPGERLDVEFTADNPGNWLLAAYDRGWGESGLKVPVVYRGSEAGEPSPPDFRRGLVLAGYGDLRAAEPRPPRAGGSRLAWRQVLSGGMHSPYWTINGRVWPRAERLAAPLGARVRLAYYNHSPMPHPMHLHGRFFRLVNPQLPPELWLTKDTVLVEPMQGLEIDFLADNPGSWLHHCHNLYHMEAGMANLVEVAA